MKIAIWLKEHITSPKLGGGHSYYQRFVELVDTHGFSKELNVCFGSFGNYSHESWKKETHFMTPEYSTASLSQRVIYKLLKVIPWGKAWLKKLDSRIIENNKAAFIKYLEEQEIDLIMYPTQMTYDERLKNFPSIMINWDLGHMSCHGLFEFIQPGALEYRNKFYDETLRRASLIITESEAGKQELIHYLNFNPEKIEVAPQFPGHLAFMSVDESIQESAIKKFNLAKDKFFFYPAQFWPHKNHFNLLQAFRRIAAEQSEIKLVFTGSDKGNMNYIKRVTTELGLNDHVFFLGFVEDEELFSLYKNALALVMPTFLGPTNMPLLEALHLGCPVATSNLIGHQEILQDSALYFAPEKADEIYDVMEQLRDEDLRNELKLKMKDFINTCDFSESNYIRSLENAFLKISGIRKCWGNKKDEVTFW